LKYPTPLLQPPKTEEHIHSKTTHSGSMPKLAKIALKLTSDHIHTSPNSKTTHRPHKKLHDILEYSTKSKYPTPLLEPPKTEEHIHSMQVDTPPLNFNT
jgi:hypothetical protein